MSRSLPLGLLLWLLVLCPACTILPKILILDDPLSQEEHLTLAMIYENEGKLDLAIREYELAPSIPFAAYALGNVYFLQGDYKKAETQYRRAIRMDGLPEAYSNLSFLLVTQGKDLEDAYEYALKAVEEAIKRDLDDNLIRNFKANLNLAETALIYRNKGYEH
ncbi:MAG: tetratricopeptide repeat protein [Deltaproteobacteria bacterium]|nr:tetratricopeptide repeat protein [Deltaproteobacteria bacterium]